MRKKKIILASQSERRKKLLKELGLKFRIIVPKGDEISNKKRPSGIVKDIAYKKVLEVEQEVKQGIIIGADTLVVCKGEIIGKPKSIKHAEKILENITKGPHYVYTGIAVKDLYTNKVYKDYDVTEVRMRKIPKKRIKELARKHLDKAGAYGIQEKEDNLVKSIKGDYHNVVGLPIKKLMRILKSLSRS